MVQKENFEKHDARAMSSSVQIRKKPSALADGVVTEMKYENQHRKNREGAKATGPNGHGTGEEGRDYPTSIFSLFTSE